MFCADCGFFPIEYETTDVIELDAVYEDVTEFGDDFESYELSRYDLRLSRGDTNAD